MNCKEALPLIHEYLDGYLQGSEAKELKAHLLACTDCRSTFNQMETCEALIRSLPKAAASSELSAQIMANLPPVKKRSSFMKWIKLHPAVSVAVVFLMVMIGSFLSMWNDQTELLVQGPDLNDIVIQGNKVIVPKGHTVDGNLTVQRGIVEVEDGANVKGNLTIIDGRLNLASTAYISGQITPIDDAVSWAWFKVSEWFNTMSAGLR
jgi:anti-sigma factor RsiW